MDIMKYNHLYDKGSPSCASHRQPSTHVCGGGHGRCAREPARRQSGTAGWVAVTAGVREPAARGCAATADSLG
jgi:hypothetical protein